MCTECSSEMTWVVAESNTKTLGVWQCRCGHLSFQCDECGRFVQNTIDTACGGMECSECFIVPGRFENHIKQYSDMCGTECTRAPRALNELARHDDLATVARVTRTVVSTAARRSDDRRDRTSSNLLCTVRAVSWHVNQALGREHAATTTRATQARLCHLLVVVLRPGPWHNHNALDTQTYFLRLVSEQQPP